MVDFFGSFFLATNFFGLAAGTDSDLTAWSAAFVLGLLDLGFASARVAAAFRLLDPEAREDAVALGDAGVFALALFNCGPDATAVLLDAASDALELDARFLGALRAGDSFWPPPVFAAPFLPPPRLAAVALATPFFAVPFFLAPFLPASNWASTDLDAEDLGAEDLGDEDLGDEDLGDEDLAEAEDLASERVWARLCLATASTKSALRILEVTAKPRRFAIAVRSALVWELSSAVVITTNSDNRMLLLGVATLAD